MASKGKNVKLQTEINSSEDLVDFLNQYRDSLLVLDVYSEFFGPCKSMISCLRKAKGETDILQLAIVNCDNIDVLRRFKNRSKPCFLYVFNGKVVNSFFGCNIPGMIQLTRDEVQFYKSTDDKSARKKFELSQLTPAEIEIHRAEKLAKILQKRADAEATRLKAKQYTTHVLDEIVSHAAESGVTIFMPHVVSRDLYKKVIQIGENMNLTAREKVTARIAPEHLKIINFEKVNLPQVLYEQIQSKDLFMICWKIADDELRPTEELLNELKDAVTEKRTTISSNAELTTVEEIPEEDDIGLSLRSLSIIVEQKCVEKCAETFVRLDSINVELIEDELEFVRYVLDFSIDYAANNPLDPNKANDLKWKLARTLDISENDERFQVAMAIFDNLIDEIVADTEVDIEENEEPSPPSPAEETEIPDETEHFFDASDPNKFRLPPVWTPSDSKANAALIYLYFRVLTEHFLPPDPVPDPPHVAIAFKANKSAEVIDTAKPYGKDVLAFGYFDSNDWQKAKLLATSHSEYRKLQAKPSDSLVLKVKDDSDAVLMLAGLIPDFVSQNPDVGKIECKHFFPDGYINAPEEVLYEDESDENKQTDEENIE